MFLILTLLFSTNLVLAQEAQTNDSPIPVNDSSVPAEVKNNSTRSINFDFGYDALAKFNRLDGFKEYFSDSDAIYSKKSANYMSLNLSYSFFSNLFRFAFGLGFILPNTLSDNTVTSLSTVFAPTPGFQPTLLSIKITQKLMYGLNLQLFRFGYKINLGCLSLVPYVGLDFMYLRSKFIAKISGIESSQTGSNLYAPIYAGLDFVFTRVGAMSFYTGLEIGYAMEVFTHFADSKIGYRGQILRFENTNDTLVGLTGKILLGTSYNF